MAQEKILKLLMNKDDITWQSLIHELVKSNEIDPWDVDVSLLTQKYIEILKKFKEFDFHVSGKVVLAAAILLKIKSSKLVGDDMNALDSLFAQSQQTEEEDFDDFDDDVHEEAKNKQQYNEFKLIPRTPQPRNRKVTVYDLMDALQKALEVKKRRVERSIPEGMNISLPKKKVDISQVIRDVFSSIKLHFHKNTSKLSFSHLVPDQPSRDDKVYTFIPLLHLSNARKVDMHQEQHFGDIDIYMAGKGPKSEWNPEESSLKYRKKTKKI